MMTTAPVQVQFLRVADNISKQERLAFTIHDHFSQHQRVLVIAPSHEAAQYLDQLLWRTPKESFTPHMIANSPTKERVVITTTTANINNADVVVNLCPTIPTFIHTLATLYELLDLTTPEKEAQSRSRQSAYTQATLPFNEI